MTQAFPQYATRPNANSTPPPDGMGPSAIIAGAGIGGLAAALALARANFQVAIYERSDALEEFGAGIQLTPNATRVLRALDVLEAVTDVAAQPRRLVVLRGWDDMALATLPLDQSERRWGAPYLVVHRADLQRTLAHAAQRQNVALSLGASVRRIAQDDDRATVSVDRGAAAEHSADLLIGADGLRSAVRDGLGLGAARDVRFTGKVAFRATVDAHLLGHRASRSELVLRLGPQAHLIHYPVRGGSLVNIVAVIESDRRAASGDAAWDGAADLSVLRRALANWSRSTQRLLATAENWRAWPVYDRAPIPTFSAGRVALVGDAAHPMVPFLAQGAAQAIEDAGALARIFARSQDIRSGLARYSRIRAPRATRIQLEAEKQGRLYHFAGPMGLARDAALRASGADWLGARYDWLYGG